VSCGNADLGLEGAALNRQTDDVLATPGGRGSRPVIVPPSTRPVDESSLVARPLSTQALSGVTSGPPDPPPGTEAVATGGPTLSSLAPACGGAPTEGAALLGLGELVDAECGEAGTFVNTDPGPGLGAPVGLTGEDPATPRREGSGPESDPPSLGPGGDSPTAASPPLPSSPRSASADDPTAPDSGTEAVAGGVALASSEPASAPLASRGEPGERGGGGAGSYGGEADRDPEAVALDSRAGKVPTTAEHQPSVPAGAPPSPRPVGEDVIVGEPSSTPPLADVATGPPDAPSPPGAETDPSGGTTLPPTTTYAGAPVEAPSTPADAPPARGRSARS
jgi:hypothetical protein